MNQFFASCGQITEASASASVLPENIQGWFPLGWTGFYCYVIILTNFLAFFRFAFRFYLFLAAPKIFIYLYNIYLFIFCCCTQAFPSCSNWGLLTVVWGLLTEAASHCGALALSTGFSSCGTWVVLLWGMWNLPRWGIEPLSSVLAPRFLSTGPPGKFLPCLLRMRGVVWG